MLQLSKVVTILSLIIITVAQDSTVTSSAIQPTGSVISVFLFDVADGALVSSIPDRTGTNNGVQTLVVQCAPGVPSTQCDYTIPATITAGASTVHASVAYQGATLSVEYNCSITSSTTATCTYTAAGLATGLATGSSDTDTATATGITTITTTFTVAQSDFQYFAVTITAGATTVATGSSMSSNDDETSTSPSSNSGSETASRSSISATSSSATSSFSRTSSSPSAGGITSVVSSVVSSAIISSTSHAGNSQLVMAPEGVLAGILGLAALL